MDNIDDLMSNLEERENAEKKSDTDRSEDLEIAGGSEGESEEAAGRRVLVGMVEHFYDRIDVAAIRLTGGIEVGDTIEIKNADETMRLRVSSMQINKADVESASEGDDVGIKVGGRVSAGSRVYLIM
jgi:putative protease